jgi:DNA-binding MarR family transcriptional regulator
MITPYLVASATLDANITRMEPSPLKAFQVQRQPQKELRIGRAATDDDAKELRSAVQGFVRGLGLLSSDRTPWGGRLSISHAHALLILMECSQRGYKPTQRDLGRTLGIDKSNVARMCARMETDRLITQERCREDARARRLTPTEKGLRLATHVEESSRKMFISVMTLIPPHARQGVLSALEALDAAVREVMEGYRKSARITPPSSKKAKERKW